ncbi:hypothetical protein OG836_20395 [Micromonospora zamorensis]
MTDLERGVYEHLITRELADHLQRVDPALIQHHRLDPADAHNTLARHIAALASRALQSVASGDDKLHHQIAMANQIAEAIATLSPKAATEQDQVTDAKHLLHAIAAPPTPPAGPHLPPAPHHSPLHRRAAGQRPPPAPHRPRGQPRDGVG